MNQDIASYIEQQIEAAKADEARKRAEDQAEAGRKAQEVKAVSLANTLRALSLMGIEAGESDLDYSPEDGYSLMFNQVSLYLQRDGSNKQWLQEEQRTPNFRDRNLGEAAHTYVRFVLYVARVIPAELINEDGEFPSGFSGTFYIRHEIEARLAEGVTRIPESAIQPSFKQHFPIMSVARRRLQTGRNSQANPKP
jgi:hypothetical protein